MYVKVTAGNHPQGQRGDFIVHAGPGPIYSDFSLVPIPEGWTVEDGVSALDFEEVLGTPLHQLHVLEFQPSHVDHGNDANTVCFKYAWWDEEGSARAHAVVTTRNIFIMSDEGKTIDRV